MLDSIARKLADNAGLFDGYRPQLSSYDEMYASDGTVRPHWEYMTQALAALGRDELNRRAEETRRILYENGVTYNVYGQTTALPRLWPLDPVPLLMTSGEWSKIEQCLVQRAELLDLLLADLYGARRLLRDGVLPPALMLAHPGFLRPCHDVVGKQRRPLALYTADLARTPDGQMQVIGDRTQAPSGAGYALENRLVLSQVLPSLYRDSHVHRLALFFRALRLTLQGLAPAGQQNPHIAVLTPGPASETYFEHAYLADYLGFTLVEGGDLVVRDDRLWLKALDGLKAVDVLLRRVDDVFCDPLELRGDSLLGAAGLLHAARSGTVGIANPLGSSVLENPGLMAFLPQVCRELLGEDLKLSSVPTWWCGDGASCAYVCEHLDQLVIKPIFPHPSTSTVFAATLSTGERSALVARIRARPHLFVAQAQLALSTAPVMSEGALEARRLVLRTFLTASTDGFAVMPGGLVRVAPATDTWLVSNQVGGVSKDLWVLASEPERQLTLLTSEDQSACIARGDDSLPARVADDLFWLGRYASRTEACARLLREVLMRFLGSERTPADDGLVLLARAIALQMPTPTAGNANAEAPLDNPEAEILKLLADGNQIGSLRFNVDALVRTGSSVRDRLSGDASRVIRALDRAASAPADLPGALRSLQRVIMFLSAFVGLCHEGMSRGPGWAFLEIGRRLEHALQTAVLLRLLFLDALEIGSHQSWEVLLGAALSLKTFRRRYRSRLQPAAILELLLLDPNNPRSLAFHLVNLEQLVTSLSGSSDAHRSLESRLALEALTRLRLFDTEKLGAPEKDSATNVLDDLLLDISLLLTQLSDEITRRYFHLGDTPHQLLPQQ